MMIFLRSIVIVKWKICNWNKNDVGKWNLFAIRNWNYFFLLRREKAFSYLKQRSVWGVTIKRAILPKYSMPYRIFDQSIHTWMVSVLSVNWCNDANTQQNRPKKQQSICKAHGNDGMNEWIKMNWIDFKSFCSFEYVQCRVGMFANGVKL